MRGCVVAVTGTVVGGKVVGEVVLVGVVVVGALVVGVERRIVVVVVDGATGVVEVVAAMVVVTEWRTWWCTFRGNVVVGAVVSLALLALLAEPWSFDETTANARPTATAPVKIHEIIPRIRCILSSSSFTVMR